MKFLSYGRYDGDQCVIQINRQTLKINVMKIYVFCNTQLIVPSNKFNILFNNINNIINILLSKIYVLAKEIYEQYQNIYEKKCIINKTYILNKIYLSHYRAKY